MPSLLSEGLFEADGQMHDEVFNDHAFKQSLMYAKGVVCSDCHTGGAVNFERGSVPPGPGNATSVPGSQGWSPSPGQGRRR